MPVATFSYRFVVGLFLLFWNGTGFTHEKESE